MPLFWIGGNQAAASSTFSDIGTKEPVRFATITSGTLASDFENGDSIDSFSLVTGDRILIKDQTDGSENGIYTVNASGAPTRATDFDSDSEVVGGQTVMVLEGRQNKKKIFMLTNTGTITVGTTALTFETYQEEVWLYPKAKEINKPDYTLIEGFQSGHGFALDSGNGTFSDDTTDYFVGSQGLKLVTPGDAVNNLISLNGLSPAVNGTGKYFALAVKCDDWPSVGVFNVQFGHDDIHKWVWTWKTHVQRLPNDTWIMLPMAIIQTPTFTQAGYMFSKTGSPNFTAMDFLKFVIADDGVGTPTIRIGGFFSFPSVSGGAIILRHDDNNDSHWTKAMPYLNENNLKGTFTLIPETMTDAYQKQMFAAQDFGHDVIVHSGQDFVDDVIAGTVEGELRKVLKAAYERGIKSTQFFNYGGGGQNDEIVNLMKKYFRASLSGNNFPGTIPPTDPYSIPFMDGMSDTTADTIAAIDDCMNNDCLCVITVHGVVDSSPAAGQILTASYETIIDHIVTQGYTVKTLSQVLYELG